MIDDHSHLVKKQGDFHCLNCKRVIRTETGVARHIEIYCEECLMCSAERTSFNVHNAVYHPKDHGSDNPTPHTLKCKTCEKVLLDDATLAEHMILHNSEILLCEECGDNFSDGNALRDHLESKHLNSKPQEHFPCEVCGLVFDKFRLLQAHVESYHNAEGVTCDHCKTNLKILNSSKTT